MLIAPNGQTSEHLPQPVQLASLSSRAVLIQFTASKLRRCGSHAPTHLPQPVHFAAAMWGSGRRTFICTRIDRCESVLFPDTACGDQVCRVQGASPGIPALTKMSCTSSSRTSGLSKAISLCLSSSGSCKSSHQRLATQPHSSSR